MLQKYAYLTYYSENWEWIKWMVFAVPRNPKLDCNFWLVWTWFREHNISVQNLCHTSVKIYKVSCHKVTMKGASSWYRLFKTV